jgi:hypothetical protein
LLALLRGSNHIRIIAIGSAVQNKGLSEDTICIGGATTNGKSTCFAGAATVDGALFLRFCRRLTFSGVAFFDEPLVPGFLRFRIIRRPAVICSDNNAGHAKVPPSSTSGNVSERAKWPRRGAA